MKRLRPALVAAVLPVLIVLLCGCSGTPAEAAPLNVEAISGIKAYRGTLVATIHFPNRTLNVRTTEDVIVPDRASGVSTESVDGKTITANAIRIGNRVWIKTDADWQEQSISPAVQEAGANASMQFCTAFKGLPARAESFQGRRAIHYSNKGGSTAALESAFHQFDSAFKMMGVSTADTSVHVLSADLWTTTDGAHPLRFKLKLAFTTNGAQSTAEAQADYSDIDGSDIDIEPPA